MSVYRGVLNIPVGSRSAYVDIDPPQAAGYCSRLIGTSLGVDTVGENANTHVSVIASVKGTPRTTFDLPTDGIPSDAIFAAMLPATGSRGLNDLLKDGFLFGEGYISQWPYVLDKMRLLVYLQDAVAGAADVDVAYELHFDEVRITNEIQQELLAKIYT